MLCWTRWCWGAHRCGGTGHCLSRGAAWLCPLAGGVGRSARCVSLLYRAGSGTGARYGRCGVLQGAVGCCSRRAAAVKAERDLLEPQGWLFAKEQEQRLVQQAFQGSLALGFLTTCENPVCVTGSESLQKMSVSQKLVTHKNRHG